MKPCFRLNRKTFITTFSPVFAVNINDLFIKYFIKLQNINIFAEHYFFYGKLTHF